MNTRTKQLTTDMMLLMVAFFWGATFIIVKHAVASVDVFTFLGARFSIAFLLLGLMCYRHLFPVDWRTVRAGICLGTILFASFAFQTWGLTITSATNGALITGLNVVLVPIFSLIWLRTPPAPTAAAGVVTAAAGLFILSGGTAFAMNSGDLLIFFCAIAVAFHIILTGYYAPDHDIMALVTWQLGTGAILGVVCSHLTGGFTLFFPAPAWRAVIITAVLCTVFAFVAQTYAQRTTPPTRAALIFTGEPVFGALFAHFYGHEPLLIHHMTGGGLIFLGMIMAEIRPRFWKRTLFTKRYDGVQHPL